MAEENNVRYVEILFEFTFSYFYGFSTVVAILLKRSPTHGRGIALLQYSEWKKRRITPAWAGNSLKISDKILRKKDHPRMGGE